MYTLPMLASKVLFGFLFMFAVGHAADCHLPGNLFSHRSNDLFDDAREMDLGDAVDDELSRSLRVIESPKETEFLSRVAALLLANAPATGIQFRFTLFDSPEANAFSLPGGHVYITRKLIALLQSPDEVAAIVGHEMGHVLAHQGSFAISVRMRRVLKIEKLASRDEVFKQYALLSEAYLNQRGTDSGKDREREDQAAADRIAVSLLIAAGYDPDALVTSLDRITGSSGQHGNLVTDMFGLTPPEGKRIRELEKTVDRLPGTCSAVKEPISMAELKSWQERVLKLTVSDQAGNLPGLIGMRQLAPALTDDMQYMHFSPDGKFAIAQDAATIHVLSVTPFNLLFDIPASGAGTPRISPDSAYISFVTDTLRFEKWNLAQQKQVAVRELQFPDGCSTTRLSPVGDLIACVQPNKTLSLSRIESGEVLFEKDVSSTVGGAFSEILSFLAMLIPASVEFSPNQSWLLVHSPMSTGALLIDLHSFKPVKLTGKAQTALSNAFVFVRDDQVLVRGSRGEPGALVEIPTGNVLETLVLPNGEMVPLSDPRFVLIETQGKYAAVVVNLPDKQVVIGSAGRSLDIRNNLRFAVTTGGQLRLTKDKSEAGSVALQNPMLGASLKMTASTGLDWMAVSNGSRAAVWNTQTGEGYLSFAFEHAEFSEGNFLRMVTAPLLDQKQMVLSVDLNNPTSLKREDSNEDPAKAPVHFWNGSVRFLLKQSDKGSTLEACDGLGKTLWTEDFSDPPFPARSLSPELLAISWPAASGQGSKLIKADAEMKKEKTQTKFEALVLQVRDARTGAVLKERLVSTAQGNSLAVKANVLQNSGLTLAGKWVVLQEPGNRIVIQRWDDGSVVARSFGRALAFDPAGAKLVVQNRERELKMINLNTGTESDALQFPVRVVAVAFRRDGRRLAAITADQKVYTLEIQ